MQHWKETQEDTCTIFWLLKSWLIVTHDSRPMDYRKRRNSSRHRREITNKSWNKLKRECLKNSLAAPTWHKTSPPKTLQTQPTLKDNAPTHLVFLLRALPTPHFFTFSFIHHKTIRTNVKTARARSVISLEIDSRIATWVSFPFTTSLFSVPFSMNVVWSLV